MFKINTAHRMMLPYTVVSAGANWGIQPRLTESMFMIRLDDPRASEVIKLKTPEAQSAYFVKVLKTLTEEGFETTIEELKDWLDQGFIVVTYEEARKERA